MVALDLGSNTLRVVKLDCQNLQRVDEYEKIVRTADQMHKSGKVSDEAVERVITAIREAQEQMGFDASNVVAATTAAIRKASNQSEVLSRIEHESGVRFQVIDGEDEAYFTSLAVYEALKRIEIQKDFLLVDIGGGSTEVILWDGGKVISQSFDIGIVPIAQKYKKKESIAAALPGLMEELGSFVSDMRHLGIRPEIFTATAGTPTTIAAIMQGMDYQSYDYQKINGYVVKKQDLDTEMKRLLKANMAEREKLVGVGRADLIIAGILIFKEIYKICRFEECTVVDDGLREGLAIAKCRNLI